MEALNMYKYSRTSTLILLNKFPEKKWDIQPEGFPNTFRWNAGHIFCTAEDYLNEADNDYKITNPEWFDLFLDGTRPSEWPEDVPSAKEIIEALKAQQQRIFEYFQGKLKQEASKTRDVNGLMLNNIESSLQFVTWHEGIHIGVLNAMTKILK